MLLSDKVMVRWSGATRKWFEQKGYSPFKNLQYFEVKVEDLMPRSEVKVLIQCDYCGAEIKKVYKDYKASKEETVIDKDACGNCNTKKSKESNLILYGVENPLSLDDIRKKIKQTNNVKYGGDNPFSDKKVRDKAKETIRKRYGVEYASQCEEVKNKTKQTNLERYGAENIFQVEEFKEKSIQTSRRKYGVDFYNQTDAYQEQRKNSAINKYGVDHHMKVKEIHDKVADKRRHSFDYVDSFFNDLDYRLITDTYINVHEDLEYICLKHHQEGIQIVNFSRINSGQRCRYCTIENKRKEIEFKYREIVRDKGYEFIGIFFEKDRAVLKTRCLKHFDKGIQEISANEFIKYTGCKYCGDDIVAVLKRNSLDKVTTAFDKRNYILLNPKDYKNSRTTLQYICLKHIDEGIQETNFSNVNRGNTCCKCKYDSVSGENHYLWKGGISPLHNYLRDKIGQWKRDSLKEYDFKCAITNINDSKLVVHHLYGFNQILSEVMIELNLPIHNSVSGYSQEELDKIQNLLLVKHYEYGMGLPLLPNIHDLFHKSYGKGNNTPEQFYEFKERYYNGEFNLEEADIIPASFLYVKEVLEL